MNFSEALTELKNGQRLTRRSWDGQEISFEKVHKELIVKFYSYQNYTPIMDDFLCDDWVVLDEDSD